MAGCLAGYHGGARLCNEDKATTATLVYRLPCPTTNTLILWQLLSLSTAHKLSKCVCSPSPKRLSMSPPYRIAIRPSKLSVRPLTSCISQPRGLQLQSTSNCTSSFHKPTYSIYLRHSFYSKPSIMASAHAYHLANTRKMSAAGAAPSATVATAQAQPHTTTALNRWSVAERTLPRKLFALKETYFTVEISNVATAVDKIKAIHVYDFDNTRSSRRLFAHSSHL